MVLRRFQTLTSPDNIRKITPPVLAPDLLGKVGGSGGSVDGRHVATTFDLLLHADLPSLASLA
jgi:hypothetical protein